MVAKVKPGTAIALEVWRNGKTKELSATIGELKGDTVVAEASEAAAQGKLGVAVRALTAEERKSADGINGVVVEDVAGAAERAGVRPGDVIVAVNNTRVTSPEQLKELIAKAGKTVALLIQRDDARIFVPVTIG
jgi:serine protease Do